MNWTGGSLQRTKNANKGVVQKQRAYFARARTNLQNAADLPAVPFRPSFLRDNDDFDLTERMPSFGAGSIRHTGHPARRRGERFRQKTGSMNEIAIPDDEPVFRPEAGQKLVAHSPVPGQHPARRDSKETHSRKRGATDTNLDTQLLEANRKRLLRQQDWVGIDPSKPVNLRCLSHKEKYRVGKRKKIQGNNGTTARLNDTAKFTRQLPQPAGEARTGIFMTRKPRHDFDDIQIQIGMDASTTTIHSGRPNGSVQSQASSDPMLFDQDDRAAERARRSESVQTTSPQLDLVRNASRYVSAAPHEHPFTDETTQPYRSFTHQCELHSIVEASGQGSPSYDQNGFRPQNIPTVRASKQASSVSAPQYRITHQVEGIERPLHFLFGDSNSSASVQGQSALQNSIDESNDALDAASAGASQTGCMHQLDSDNEQLIADDGLTAPSIVDEEPWKTFLAISDGSSSHSPKAMEPGNSLLRSHHPALNNEAVTKWSQHTTCGDQTRASSSCTSASLPSLRRGIEQPVPTQRSSAESNWRGNPVGRRTRGLDDDERLWQAFVFGSGNDNSSSADTQNRRGSRRGRSISKDFGELSSRYLPLSVAVSPIASTPFKTISGLASCISDNVQDAAAFAPPSGSRAFTSPAFHGFVDGLSKEMEDDSMAKRSSLGEHSVTHASLLDNASCEAARIFPQRPSDTKRPAVVWTELISQETYPQQRQWQADANTQHSPLTTTSRLATTSLAVDLTLSTPRYSHEANAYLRGDDHFIPASGIVGHLRLT